MRGLIKKRLWQVRPMKSSYDAVIIGGGLHGLATAYFLARNHGMNRVAVRDRRCEYIRLLDAKRMNSNIAGR